MTFGVGSTTPFFNIMGAHIKVLGSGSSGNCLVVCNGKEQKLLIDLGINAMQIIQSVNYKIEDWSAAICSHR